MPVIGSADVTEACGLYAGGTVIGFVPRIHMRVAHRSSSSVVKFVFHSAIKLALIFSLAFAFCLLACFGGQCVAMCPLTWCI